MALVSINLMDLVKQDIIALLGSHRQRHPYSHVRKVTAAWKALIDHKDAHQDTTRMKS